MSSEDQSRDEERLLPISALSHLVFCERRAALIHVEHVWMDNEHTVHGSQLHEAVDESARRVETRGTVRVLRAVHVRSFSLGVYGIADVVELHGSRKGGIRATPFPVEYKSGKPKPDNSDTVQLCAQAIALEEMLHVAVPAGALFYGKTQHRLEVVFGDALRALTASSARRLRQLIETAKVPLPVLAPKCSGCSLAPLCIPAPAGNRRVSDYLNGLVGGR